MVKSSKNPTNSNQGSMPNGPNRHQFLETPPQPPKFPETPLPAFATTEERAILKP